MFRIIFRSSGTLCAAVVAPEAARDPGWARVKNVFTKDEFGNLSPEMVTILQTAFLSAFFGAFYGGFTHSREAYLRFIERNDATKFVDHFEAKKKLQDTVTMGFAKGAMKWGWRIASFSSIYMTSVTLFSAYRGEMKLLDFVTAGILAGGLYRANHGFRGVMVGSCIGTFLGLFAGSLSVAMLKLSGTNYDDIYAWNYENINIRNRKFAERLKTKFQGEENTKLLEEHDDTISEQMEH
ncbi:RPII140-upstream gene protein isoform X2 [Cimex lectularius]|uniref:Complex I assembly factor TIMMDC1, mitochondrial n=1 Tax=Cimex lectularius TaxID=79782 RepID=A0A8I6S8K3_CIMLE|nr:RPII140-upstream gene protein isoform X2 [Cimex lectularius]